MKLEGQFFDAAWTLDKLSREKGYVMASAEIFAYPDPTAYGTSHAEMGNSLISVANTDSHQRLGGRIWHTTADTDQAESINECVILGNSLGCQELCPVGQGDMAIEDRCSSNRPQDHEF
jgi:hypothetical protein